MTTDTSISAGKRLSRIIFVVLAWAMAACIVVQTFLAGMAVFNDPARWALHRNFVHIFEFLPLLMLIFVFAGRLPKGIGWPCLLLFVLIYLQYMTAHLPGAGAVHPVMALALIVLSLHVARKAQRYI